jgi:hypothetical protein
VKKEMYAGTAFAGLIENLVALAGAADTPPMVIYGIFRAWTLAYETMWEDFGVDPAVLAQLQSHSWKLAQGIIKKAPAFCDCPPQLPLLGRGPDPEEGLAWISPEALDVEQLEDEEGAE